MNAFFVHNLRAHWATNTCRLMISSTGEWRGWLFVDSIDNQYMPFNDLFNNRWMEGLVICWFNRQPIHKEHSKSRTPMGAIHKMAPVRVCGALFFCKVRLWRSEVEIRAGVRSNRQQKNIMAHASVCSVSGATSPSCTRATVQPLPKVKWLLRGSKNRFDSPTW